MTQNGGGNAHLSEASSILSLAHGTPPLHPRPPRMARCPRQMLSAGHLRALRAACSGACAIGRGNSSLEGVKLNVYSTLSHTFSTNSFSQFLPPCINLCKLVLSSFPAFSNLCSCHATRTPKSVRLVLIIIHRHSVLHTSLPTSTSMY